MGDHLIVLHSAVRGLPGYSRHEAPSMLMQGSSMALDSEHGRALTAQLTRRHGTLEEAIEAASFALGAADVPRGVRRQARAACEDYFYERLGHAPETELDGRAEPPAGLEPMPDPMYRVLSDIVELVVDGDYEELHTLSRNRLAVDDLRRRLEEDCPEPLILPPREAYRDEAISRSEDLEVEGFTFFLELWTETGLARLHVEGVLVEEEPGSQRVVAALSDILP